MRETEERNSLAVQQALDVYEELKEKVREDEHEYGPALFELQKQIKVIEKEFTQFVTLNTSGDPVEAREVLDKAEKHTYEVEALMKKFHRCMRSSIPLSLNNLKKSVILTRN